MKIVFSLVVLSTFLHLGCDPVRRIDMRNESNDTAFVVWKLNEDSLANNPFLISNSDELKFSLYPPKNKRINMSFGAGGWTPSEVQKLVGYLKSLEIVSPSHKIKIDSLPLLKDFLLARRKGIGGARIEIVIPR